MTMNTTNLCSNSAVCISDVTNKTELSFQVNFPLSFPSLNLNYNPCKIKFSRSSSPLTLQLKLPQSVEAHLHLLLASVFKSAAYTHVGGWVGGREVGGSSCLQTDGKVWGMRSELTALCFNQCRQRVPRFPPYFSSERVRNGSHFVQSLRTPSLHQW